MIKYEFVQTVLVVVKKNHVLPRLSADHHATPFATYYRCLILTKLSAGLLIFHILRI